MKKSWIFGVILAVSVALNALMGGILIGQKLNRQIGGTQVVGAMNGPNLTPRLINLPPEQRRAIRAKHGDELKTLRQAMREVRDERSALATYIKSPHYNRTEAERRMVIIRTKHTQAQEMAHKILLDVADELSSEDRAKMLKGQRMLKGQMRAE